MESSSPSPTLAHTGEQNQNFRLCCSSNPAQAIVNAVFSTLSEAVPLVSEVSRGLHRRFISRSAFRAQGSMDCSFWGFFLFVHTFCHRPRSGLSLESNNDKRFVSRSAQSHPSEEGPRGILIRSPLGRLFGFICPLESPCEGEMYQVD